jgi:hypothetical protein
MRIARDKDALVAAHLVSKSGSFQWGVSFIRAAHDWEVDVVASFFTLLHSIRVGSLPYLGRLVIVIDRCCMCKMNGKSVDHLLLHCEGARALWNAIFSCFSLSCVMSLQVVDLFACFWTGGRSRSAVVWKMVLSCLLWCFWRDQNDRHFEDKERTIEEFITFFFFSLFSWTTAFLAPLVLVLIIFLFFFLLLLSRFSCMLYVLDCALRFLIILLLLIKKKKNTYILP